MTPGRRILYLDSYTVADPRVGAASSDTIGYGVTASAVIREGLQSAGHELVRPYAAIFPSDEDPRLRRLDWLIAGYGRTLRALVDRPPDLVFFFHAFHAFPAEIRRMLLDLRLSIPLVGYTHGSHWDPTDSFRFEAYPGMELVDLANLSVLDRILLVSDYMRSTLRSNVAALNPNLAEQLDAKAEVVGLPLDTARIDRQRTTDRFERTTVVYNHAPVSSKRPEAFARVMQGILRCHPVDVLLTRRFDPGSPGGTAVADLVAEFGRRVRLGADMSIDEYYRALWMSDIQVSTATHESLGMATLEAMYTGNCCLLPRLGSYPEICEGHPDVLYDPAGNSLEERLTYFIEHPQRRTQVAAELSRIARKHRPDVVLERVLRVVAEV